MMALGCLVRREVLLKDACMRLFHVLPYLDWIYHTMRTPRLHVLTILLSSLYGPTFSQILFLGILLLIISPSLSLQSPIIPTL